MSKKCTIVLTKKGRKYWSGHFESKTYNVNVIINDLTANWAPGQTVTFEANDLTTNNGYGTKFLYEPVPNGYGEFERYIGYAEQDVKRGYDHSNAIITILSQKCPEPFKDRVNDLKKKIEKNRINALKAREEQRIEWAKEKQERDNKRHEAKSHRVIRGTGELPQLNIPLRLSRNSEDFVIYTDYGKQFPCPEEEDWRGYDYVCYVYYREATPEETEQGKRLETEKAEAEIIKKEKQKEIRALKELVEAGEYPNPEILENERVRLLEYPTGDNFVITPFNLYGSGEEFVINSNYIWLIQNNGADGDNWSWNNIRTGGAGAIGHRVPYNESTANRIKAVLPANHKN